MLEEFVGLAVPLGLAGIPAGAGSAAWADDEVVPEAPPPPAIVAAADVPASPLPPAPASPPPPAEESNDEEARIARKLALQKRSSSPLPASSTSGLPNAGFLEPSLAPRADFNPEAGANLRKRSLSESMAVEKKREKEYKRTREDLCEVLGRGC